eukprot:scaffold1050_cov130-Isochrysis_galbana.AAC.2
MATISVVEAIADRVPTEAQVAQIARDTATPGVALRRSYTVALAGKSEASYGWCHDIAGVRAEEEPGRCHSVATTVVAA